MGAEEVRLSGCVNFRGEGMLRCQFRTWKSRKEMSSLLICRSEGEVEEVSCEAMDFQTLLPMAEYEIMALR
jgi:hypothetical protein